MRKDSEIKNINGKNETRIWSGKKQLRRSVERSKEKNQRLTLRGRGKDVSEIKDLVR